MAQVTIDVEKLLSFFDSDAKARTHSSSLKALVGEELMLALLIEYFRLQGTAADVVDRVCTTGARAGYRLDGWVRIQHPTPAGVTHYQTEVKSWSAHGVGGGSLYLGANSTGAELATFKVKVWERYWRDGRFLADGLNKVLVPMKAPEGAARILPLACLWAPVHPTGLAEPFFEVATIGADFPSVCVFSASSFLRGLGQAHVVLPLPTFAQRMTRLGEMFLFA